MPVEMFLSVVLAVQVWFGTYSVLDAGKPGTPVLTSRQRRWLESIRATSAYAKRWNHLRFTEQIAPDSPNATPLIVFDVQDWTPKFTGATAFHVIGEPCNAFYSPTVGRMVSTTEATGCPKYQFPPVHEEESAPRPL